MGAVCHQGGNAVKFRAPASMSDSFYPQSAMGHALKAPLMITRFCVTLSNDRYVSPTSTCLSWTSPMRINRMAQYSERCASLQVEGSHPPILW